MKLIFATHNEGKVKEMKNILAGLPWEILSAREAGVMEEPVEDGTDFAENSLIKAKFVADRTHEWSVADDSGLCVEALSGAPGVFSARWAGENATGEEKAEKVLRELGGVPSEKRSAYFESSVALIAPDGRHWIFTGRAQGKITTERREKIKRPHLPYDAIFIPDGFDNTFGEMADEEKNALSHRGQAFRQLKEFLLSDPAKQV
jgi:XTP/dITP diphosphohydrolase